MFIMFIKKHKHIFITAAAILLLCAISAGVWAAGLATYVSALLDPNIAFIVDGQRRDLGPGYTVLNYDNHTYVPSRFVAEAMGATVNWDAPTKIIRIDSAFSSADYLALQKDKADLEAQIREKDTRIADLEAELKRVGGGSPSSSQPSVAGNYQRIPLSMALPEAYIMVTGIYEDDIYKLNRIYLEVENRKDTPIQLLQNQTKATVGGITYRSSDAILHYTPDTEWYKDIYKDDRSTGYILMPLFPEDSKEMLLELTILINDGDQRTLTAQFAVRLD